MQIQYIFVTRSHAGDKQFAEILELDECSKSERANNLDQVDGKKTIWPDDLRIILQILHSKVANRRISSVPFISAIIANDSAFAGAVDPIIFARIIAKVGISKVESKFLMHVAILFRSMLEPHNTHKIMHLLLRMLFC
jgi:hypothetical protein